MKLSVKYFNFSIGEILVCPNSFHNTSQPYGLPSTMSYLATSARTLRPHVNICVLELQLFPDSPGGFCFTSSSTNSQQAEARRKAWKHLNVFLCSFQNGFKYCINKSPAQCRKDHGIDDLRGKKWSKVCATLKHKTCACEMLGALSWPVSHWSQGNVFM